MASKPLISYTPEHRELYKKVLQRQHDSYCKILADPATNAKDFWDVVVITAIDDDQKSHYEQLLQDKLLRGEIPHTCKYHVIADPKGPKIGCGGSTFVVLDFLEHLYGHALDHYRIFLIHAGGYSKRLPNHTTGGKIFCPVPFLLQHTGQCISMLEMKFILFVDFPKKMRAGVFLTCADDIELFESEGSDFTRPGVTAMAHPSTTDIGLTHGVFVLEEKLGENIGNAPRACSRFLHKPTLEAMKSAGAIQPNSFGEIFTDSNFYFDRNFSKTLLQYYHSIQLDCEIDAHGDFLQPLGNQATEDYVTNSRTTGSNPSTSLIEKRKGLYSILKNTPISVIPLLPSLFIHIGTVKEYIEHLTIYLPDFGYQRFVASQIVDKDIEMISDKSCVMHSVLGNKVRVGDRTVLEYSTALNRKDGKELVLGGNSIISQVVFSQDIQLEDPIQDVFLHTVVVHKKSYVTILFGIHDDLKSLQDSPTKVILKNISIEQVIPHLGLSYQDVWPDNKDFGLWTARLFPICSQADLSSSQTLQLLSVLNAISQGISPPQYNWKNLPRASLSTIIIDKDIEGQGEYRNEQEDRLVYYQVLDLFKRELPVTEWVTQIPYLRGLLYLFRQSDTRRERAQHRLDTLIHKWESEFKGNFLEKSRGLFSLGTFVSEIHEKHLKEHSDPQYISWSTSLKKKSYQVLRDIILSPFIPKHEEIPFLEGGKKVWPLHVGDHGGMQLPARIILAGGWSDTPPFCLERGGDILNMAVLLNKKLPITSEAKVISEPIFRLRNIEAKTILEVPRTDIASLFDYDQPGQAISLHKACLCFVLFPQFAISTRPADYVNKCQHILEKIVGHHGIELTTHVNIPQGSGLGTSSILILTCIQALRKLFAGEIHSDEQLEKEFNAVLAIEQMLTTGGGWQDQIGGGIRGIKFITAAPSLYPRYQISTVKLSPKHVNYLNDKLLVVWTGKTRMAKAILTNVVDNWLIRRKGIETLLNAIKKQARDMNEAFIKFANTENPHNAEDQFIRLGEILDQAKKTNIQLEESITNEYINSLFELLQEFVTGSNIIGAGSGGYIVGWLKQDVSKEVVSEALKQTYPDAQVTDMTLWAD